VEENTVRLSGTVRELKTSRTSPAGAPHRELVLEHRSRQIVAGQMREVRAQVIVKINGRELMAVLESVSPGNRIIVTGMLAQASHHDAQQLLIHAQTIEKHE
jgi:primosomal replication protein PriB